MRKLAGVLCVVAMSWLAGGGLRAVGTSPVVLVVVNGSSGNPFGPYLAEILRAEGITAFGVASLDSIDAATLDAASLVLLAETPLTAPQAALFTGFVNGGGRLVAMRPDPQLHGVLGIAAAAGTTSNGYTLIDQSGPGAGLPNLTLPFKGPAQHFVSAGATTVASLYTTRTTASAFPAVVRHNRTAAWAFDLARSTAYTRQGDPAFAGTERDGLAPYRTTEPFYQTIDLERLAVPHADVQMRLLSRVIGDLLADHLPLPRLWYFPGTARTLLIPTGDSHVQTPSSYAGLLAAVEGVGARMTLYLARFIDMSANPVSTWVANGHDISVHPVFADDGITDFGLGYTTVFDWFQFSLPMPPGPTVRHHTLEWAGWVSPVAVMPGFGIGMDLSYSTFGPAVHNPSQQSQAHGYLNGSGLPMRFVDASGQLLPVFQQSTSLADEQLVAGLNSEGLPVAAALAVSRQLIDASQAGGHSAIATQFHVDYYPYDEVKPWVDGTLAYAASQNIPMWTARRWHDFVQARAASTMSAMSWDAGLGRLTFTMAVPGGAPVQSLMVPPSFGTRVLAEVRLDGQAVIPTAMVVNGRASQVIAVGPAAGGAPRAVSLRYVAASSLPAISVGDGAVVEGNSGTRVGNVTITLSAAALTDVAVAYSTSDGTATAGSDYDAVAGAIAVVPAGATSWPVPVTVRGDTNFEADETVVVTVANPLGATIADASGVLTIVNDEPLIAFADGYATSYVTPLTVAAPGVLANDNAHGSSGLAAVLISTTPNGTLSFNANGSFSYTPNRWFAGVETFSYRADTSSGTGNTVTVAINVAHPTVVEAPRFVRVAAITGNTVTFRWRPPGVGPEPTGYVLEGGVAPGQPLVALATSAAPVFNVTAPTGSFFVRLRTLGTGGPSGVSNEIPLHVNVPVAPAAPKVFQATVVGSAVHLSWAPSFDGGVPTGVVLDVGGSLAAALPLPQVERLAFGGAPGGAFTLSLRATNAGGSSAATAPVAIVVPGTCGAAPGPPTELLGYVAGGTTFLLWDPPLSGGAVSSYLVSVPGFGNLPLAQRSISGPLPRGTWPISVHAVGPCGMSPAAATTVVVP